MLLATTQIEDMDRFLEVFSTEMGVTAPSLEPSTLALLQSHSFPGNVRELKNVMERALILSGGGPIKPEFLQLFPSSGKSAPMTPAKSPAFDVENLPLNLEAAEQALIQRALEQTHGNVAEAARLLSINRSRIYRRFPQIGKEG